MGPQPLAADTVKPGLASASHRRRELVGRGLGQDRSVRSQS